MGEKAKSLSFICKSVDEVEKAAAFVQKHASDLKVWLFEGEMGAGKTTLVKAICKAFGVEDTVSSPTFSIVNEYRNADDEIFYHFDFYRIKDEYEAMDIGCEEYFYSGNFCFIEWPSQIPSLIPQQHMVVQIHLQSDNSRRIDLIIHDR
jgi:tRNA threonylcarbamoyladenosine biosynthesis protein TsaE